MAVHMVQLIRCVCGDEHASVARMQGYAVIVCPKAPNAGAVYFFPGLNCLIASGATAPEGAWCQMMPSEADRLRAEIDALEAERRAATAEAELPPADAETTMLRARVASLKAAKAAPFPTVREK